MKIATRLLFALPLLAPTLARANPDAPAAWVHLEGNHAAAMTLESRADRTVAWSAACHGSCDAKLPLDAEYRVTGDGLRDSPPFRLHAEPDQRVTLEVNAGTTSGQRGGIALIVFSPLVILGGFFTIVATGVGNAIGCEGTEEAGEPASSCPRNTSGVTTGEVLMGAGLVGLVAGVALLASNASSKVKQEEGTRRF